MNYHESVIQRAILDFIRWNKTWKISKPMFITLSESATLEASLDEAAFSSIDEEHYAGTVMINMDGKTVMLDLRGHGEELRIENEQDEREEAAHERELRSRFNER